MSQSREGERSKRRISADCVRARDVREAARSSGEVLSSSEESSVRCAGSFLFCQAAAIRFMI